jgi:2-polyprenyl-6-methoxyphenol hydroxylase-like FAD-dependent oxidoreductase
MHVQCVVAGGEPAGMVLGFLLARAGVRVTVLEKHADFLRDFRGDTIHPSTLELMCELGILDELLTRPHGRYDNRHYVAGLHWPTRVVQWVQVTAQERVIGPR